MKELNLSVIINIIWLIHPTAICVMINKSLSLYITSFPASKNFLTCTLQCPLSQNHSFCTPYPPRTVSLFQSFWKSWRPSIQPLIMSEHIMHLTIRYMADIRGAGQRRKNQLTKEYSEGAYHILARLLSNILNHWMYRNLGSSRWILTVESLSLPIAPGTIFTYSNRLLFCYILRSITTKVTYSGLMLRRTPTTTANCFSGFFSQYVWYLRFREKGVVNHFS